MAEANKGHVLGGTAIKPIERHGWERIRYILYNPETGQILSRTPKSWALITVFYLIYYAFLACFWGLMLFVFFQTLDNSTPKWVAHESLIGTSPGLGLRPEQTDALVDSSMIHFTLGVEEDTPNEVGWKGWASRVEAFLKTYENKTGKACDESNKPGKDETCNFQISTLGSCGEFPYGYSEGKPCIFLKLNRIYGMDNDYYNDPDNLPEEMPSEIKEHIKSQSDKNQVWVDCRGENPADVESMGEIEFFPKSKGFPAYYFPYTNQENYTSPIIAVKFNQLPVGQLIHVECRAWAKNIRYDKRDRMGISHFELYTVNKKTEL